MRNNNFLNATEEEKINKHYQSLNDQHRKSSQAHGEPVKDLGKKEINTGKYNDVFSTKIMSWTEIAEILEALNDKIDDTNNDVLDTPIGDEIGNEQPQDSSIEDQVIEQLNKIFTPILVMQSFETQVNDQIKESLEQANVLTERNIIRFDDQTRMSQLISTCALLIDKVRQTPEYKAYENAVTIKNESKINITKKNYDLAKTIVQKYLVKVSTTNNSSEARNAATDLLPETQH